MKQVDQGMMSVAPPECGYSTVISESSSIDIIVEGLRSKFGDGVGDVAARQIGAASSDTVQTWIEIVARLKTEFPSTDGKIH